ncbi:ABC transporter permease [Peptoniphilus indolicus]|uniref:ABC superfamily ATP binding cassette transporter, membrane protein n=2 Tax=Peptoniphilus indolicus TaxID=33030 RepID=G4D106_9FIRM|nr:ABC transporter permease [Peptoniphilus indolicus]EGY80795.1 hypothetical protein HMPREF9129_0086 [Peptoniphilus indolicus ATCC 29427]SUB74780.1 Macrolide export ATP-binding/permease protein MacB [Peptoniphilus indolicus]
MNLNDLISMAIKNLKARKMRTFLTVLGVIIGTTSIIVMLSIGFGFQKINTAMYSSMGNLTILDLQKNFGSMNSEMSPKTKDKKLNDTAVAEVSRVEHVTSVMPIYKASATFKSGRYVNEWVDVVAMPPKVMNDFDFKIQDGRLLTNGDTKHIVFSGGAAKNFRDPKRVNIDASSKVEPMKSKIEISKINIENSEMNGNFTEDENKPVYSEKISVVGVLVPNENDWQNYNTIYMPIDYLKKLAKDSAQFSNTTPPKFNEYSIIKVKVDDIKNVKAVQDNIKAMGYNASNIFAEILENQNKNILIVQAVFGAISAVSFLVAAIGITNTMIMSIYERTREIGVMKVIGASISDIKKLFLIEAGFIGLLGGIIGVIFSLILSFVFNILAKGFLMSRFQLTGDFEPKISYIPFWLILIALLFSCLIGILAGYFPAKRAMKLSALDAIRSE